MDIDPLRRDGHHGAQFPRQHVSAVHGGLENGWQQQPVVAGIRSGDSVDKAAQVFCRIVSGRFGFGTGKSPVNGRHRVMINGFDGVASTSRLVDVVKHNPEGRPLFLQTHVEKIDVPKKQDTVLDFTVPRDRDAHSRHASSLTRGEGYRIGRAAPRDQVERRKTSRGDLPSRRLSSRCVCRTLWPGRIAAVFEGWWGLAVGNTGVGPLKRSAPCASGLNRPFGR